MKFLEIWNTSKCILVIPPLLTHADALFSLTDIAQDISLTQWLALTPAAMVQAHLNLGDNLINNLNKTKQFVVGPAASS